jgi:hypothetical protein
MSRPSSGVSSAQDTAETSAASAKGSPDGLPGLQLASHFWPALIQKAPARPRRAERGTDARHRRAVSRARWWGRRGRDDDQGRRIVKRGSLALITVDHAAHQILLVLEARDRHPEQMQRDQAQGRVSDQLMDTF